jgi:hypothetical protein
LKGCCAVTAAGLAWIEAAGRRALPPIDRPTLTIMMNDWENEADQYAAMLEDPESVAVGRFNMLGRDFMNFWKSQRGGPWELPAGRIAEFNRLPGDRSRLSLDATVPQPQPLVVIQAALSVDLLPCMA